MAVLIEASIVFSNVFAYSVLLTRITEDFGMKYMKLILNGKTLIPGKFFFLSHATKTVTIFLNNWL